MTTKTIESRLRALLHVLTTIELSPELAEARDYLLPPGFSPVVHLEEGGRKKKSSAASCHWKPETGEMHISYKPAKAAPRFRPIPIRGESASSTLLRDRGIA